MKLILDGPQTMLAKSAADFAAQHEPVARLRALRDSGEELGYSADVWNEMVDLGWPGICFSEDAGGLGMGLAELVLVTEALGRALAPEPLVSSLLAGKLLELGGSDSQKRRWLAPMVAGEQRLATAYQERGSRYDAAHVAAEAATTADGWLLTGEKVQVVDGWGADGWLVSARTSGDERDADGVSLFLIPADRTGVSCVRQHRVDSRNVALLRFSGVPLSSSDLVGALGEGHEVLVDAIDLATVALCGEMLGMMAEAYERTLDYLKTREQFGVLIGSFQALKHRAAEMFVEIELSRSVVMAAARALDEGGEDAREHVSNCKARCSDALILVTNEALQMHGGIGMTDEHDIGLFMKRARVAEMTFGDAGHHRQRFARLRGF